jgi:dipeptidase E
MIYKSFVFLSAIFLKCNSSWISMGTIVTIGGGSIRGGTYKIDKEIVRLSGKKKPRVLFIPTASSDSEEYWEFFKKTYLKLGCMCDALFLTRDRPKSKEIKRKILSADIVYVGGGNTLMMMRLWRRLGVDALLRRAYKNGTVMAGLSAGSICWYAAGHSDSMYYYAQERAKKGGSKKWQYIFVGGLSFIQAVHCPHYDDASAGQKRETSFKKMFKKLPDKTVGLVVDNNCALVYEGSNHRVITSKRGAKAYRVYKKGKRVVQEPIPEGKARPLKELLQI